MEKCCASMENYFLRGTQGRQLIDQFNSLLEVLLVAYFNLKNVTTYNCRLDIY
jgi:hypothetical protein